MQPIVDGLEQEYGGAMAFDRVNAGTKLGRSLMRQYGVRGHPSYVIVDPQGRKLWSASGIVDEHILHQSLQEYE